MMIGGFIAMLVGVAIILSNARNLKRATSRGIRAGAYVMITVGLVVFALGGGLVFLGSQAAANS